MQLGAGIIVAVIALAAAAGAAYYVQTKHAATTTSPTQTPSTGIPVTTSTKATSTYSASTMSPPTSSTHGVTATGTTSTATSTKTAKTTTAVSTTGPSETSSATSTSPTTTTTSEEAASTSTAMSTTTTTGSPSPTRTTTTATTSSTTTTATSTSTTQTTTTRTTTTQGQTTTTTTTPKKEVLEPAVFHTYRELLQNYSYARIHYKLVNGSETTELILSYRASKTSNGYRVDINTAQIENGETSSNNTLTIFLDEAMTTVTKIIMPNGQVYEGQMAQIAGQNLLEALNHAIAMIAWIGDIKVAIAEGSYAATKAGWEVTSVEKTSATISGKTHNAYKISMLNKSDKDSDTARVDLTLVEIKKDTWIAYKLHAVQKDGSEFTWEITSLEP